jgi:hypothetical protein
MRLQKGMNLYPRLKSQETANLLFGEPSTSVSFERDALLGRTREVLTIRDHGPRDVFRHFEVDLHTVLIDVIAYARRKSGGLGKHWSGGRFNGGCAEPKLGGKAEAMPHRPKSR